MAFITSTPSSSTFVQRTASVNQKACRRRPSLVRATASVSTEVSIPTPIADRIIVRPDDFASKSAGGVMIASTENNKIKSRTGEVVAVGPGRYSPEGVRETIDFVKPGDHVMWKKDFGAQTIETDEGVFLALRIFSIIAKYSK